MLQKNVLDALLLPLKEFFNAARKTRTQGNEKTTLY